MESKQIKKYSRIYGIPLKITVFSALLAAISIVLGKYLAINAGEFLRFSLENLPILLAAMLFGAPVGAAVGAVADLVGSLMVGYAINPVITLGASAVGFLGGVFYELLKKVKISRGFKILISVFSAHLTGSVLIKGLGLYAMYGTPLGIVIPWRCLNYLIVGSLEIFILSVLLNNKAIAKMFRKTEKSHAEEFKNFANSFQAVTVPGLERISMLCELLGNPEEKLKIIHIAGTNGKGSTSANLAQILEDAGYRVGKYISPNLIKVNERISINGEDISDEELESILSEIEPSAKAVETALGLSPTQFEIWTAAAFLYFSRKECDFVILEVGLGGELDATNVIKTCHLSIITRLGLDHTQYLGNTIEEVAKAKAGIIKRGQAVPKVITLKQDGGATEIIKERAEALGNSLVLAEPTPIERDGGREIFSIAGINRIKCGIAGYHQIENASLAALAAISLGIDGKYIKSGIEKAKNPARFEILSENPTVIYDGGHNENGIAALINSLDKYYTGMPKTVIFACMKDKEIGGSLKMLAEGDTKFVFTTVKDNPRADSAEALKERANSLGFDGNCYEEIGDAYEEAVNSGRLTVICGSLYLYKDLKEYLNQNNDIHKSQPYFKR